MNRTLNMMHHSKYRVEIGAFSQHGYPLDYKHFVLKYMAGNRMTPITVAMLPILQILFDWSILLKLAHIPMLEIIVYEIE